MSQINFNNINEELLDQLERLGDEELSGETMKAELARSKQLSFKADLALLIPQNMMLLQQLRDEAPMLLICHPDIEECFQAQCNCLERLLRYLDTEELSGRPPAA